MFTNDVIKVAEEELGYIGKKSNADLYDKTANTAGKFTKYAQELFEAGYYNSNKNGYDYCCVFVDWLFYQAAGRNKAAAEEVKPVSIYGASVDYIKGMLPGRVDGTPAVGDQILFKEKTKAGTWELCHTGLVVDVQGDTITTIEGNLTGYKVGKKQYKLGDSYIDSFVHPYYEENDDQEDAAAEIFERGDVVRIKDGVTTNYAGIRLSPWVYDGRLLYVISSNASYTKITVDPNLSAVTATMWTSDLELIGTAEPEPAPEPAPEPEPEPEEGKITFVNAEEVVCERSEIKSACDLLTEVSKAIDELILLRSRLQAVQNYLLYELAQDDHEEQ